ncbi:MAG: xylulokinase [Cellvibrionaceae bacterium]
MGKYTLVIDQGGHSTRAIVFNKKGQPLAYSSEPILDALPSTTGWIEYAPESIIQSTKTLLERLLSQLKSKQLAKIHACSIIAQRSSIIACNKNGSAIGPMISWQDTRNNTWLAEQDFDITLLQEITGLRLNAHAGASKMRWLLDHDKRIQKHAEKKDLVFVPWGAYFLAQLTDKEYSQKHSVVTDPILASRTGLTEYGQLKWSEQLQTLFNIPSNTLPPIVPTTYDYGYLSLGELSIPIKLLGGDQNFIPYAYGKSAMENAAFLNIGTGAFIQAKVTLDKAKNDPLLLTAAEIETKKKLNRIKEGTINAAATALDWWQEQLPRPYSFDELNTLLKTNDIAPLFINTLAGTGSPYWLAKSPAKFIGDSQVAYTNEQKTIAIIESIIFGVVINLGYIKKTNPQIDNIIISGGLSKIDALCQTLANLAKLSVIRYKDSEASARGVVFYLNDIDHYKPKEPPQRFTPNNEEAAIVSNRLQDYKDQMEKRLQN